MNTRSLVAVVVTAGALAVPHAAGAADLYVQSGAGATTCGQDDPCSLQQAIAIADVVASPDTIHVAGSLAHAAAVDLSNSPIDLIGSGSGAGGTAIDAGAGGLLVGAGSSASALSVRSTGNAAVWLESASAIDHVAVVAAETGVRVDPIAGGQFATIRDSHVVAPNGIVDDSGANGVNAFQLERTTVEASRFGVFVLVANATVANSVIRARTSGATGVMAHNVANIAVDGSTIDGGGSGAFGVRTGEGTGATIVVRGSIVRGFGTDLFANTVRAGYGLSVSDSDYATRNGVSIGDLGGNLNADPHWVDAANGDYRLAAGSPLIDKGPPRAAAPGETDRGGASRVTDGDGDGVAVRDIGAFEAGADPTPPPGGDGTPPGGDNPPVSTESTRLTVRLFLRTQKLPGALRRGYSARFDANQPAKAVLEVWVEGRATRGLRSGARKRIRVARGTRSLTTAGRGTVTARFTRKSRAVLKRRSKVRVRVILTVTDTSGGKSVKSKRLTLRR